MAVQERERPEAETVGSSPARRLSVIQRGGSERHFQPTDPRIDLLRLPLAGRWLEKAVKSRRFQFAAILPNQIIFWLVIATGLIGVAVPSRNFSTAITWYVWFCAVFVMMVGAGRAWCLMCPFGGAGEWVQRRSFWQRHPISIGLHLKWPESWSRWGMLPSVGVFLAFDRLTCCRYLCPLTSISGTVGSTGMVAGMRTRDREICLTCATKDCMRGSERGYPCPWYEWPGSATSNMMCGLCTECVKNCPHDNVGIFVQAPLTSVIAPLRRRLDVALAVLVFFGLVIFQQVNALGFYAPMEGTVNQFTHFSGYPNPIDYIGIIALVTGLVAAYVWGLRAVFGRERTGKAKGRVSSFAIWLAPLAYGLIPLMAADYLARQLPKFWLSSPKVIAVISDPFGYGWNLFGTAHAAIAGVQILSPEGVVISQVVPRAM